ncbi:LAQU0S03e09736g1_1 [Lachancea quebecensis]|uniref:LAQU0S03e09736g1_1 n=1 Tax=Lachancea quebecensis TaxID=1654605 RepID=A0A0P1KP09_9SACH|nr:LAQU0S03e09736g1_1 [Lachancea quebecensis]
MQTEALDHELSIDEEYDLWKSNVPLMYDFVSETKLLWPSLTIQWLPNSDRSNEQELILGTHTSGAEQNYLKIASVHLPDEVVGDPERSVAAADDTKESGHQIQSKIKIVRKFEHSDEVTRARYAPFNPNLIATISGKGKVFLYDRSKDSDSALAAEYSFHKENGYGLNFSVVSPGELLSCSDDGSIAIWDICSGKKMPIKVDTSHDNIVNECKWHEKSPYLYGSVSDDSTLIIHDKRADRPAARIFQSNPYNTLAFSKHSGNLFAAAGTDSQVHLYDLRKPEDPIHSMPGHLESVTSLEFASHKDGILCSGGSDRRVLVWDLFQVGAEQQQEDADDGVPELLMMHAGHKSPVNDFSCNPSIPWLMASVEEENVVQIWKSSRKLTSPYIPRYYNIHSLE